MQDASNRVDDPDSTPSEPAVPPSSGGTPALAAALTARLPAAQRQRVLGCLLPVAFGAGDVVIRQGAPGDFHYLVQRGRCVVERRIRGGTVAVKLAELGPGDSFGEEALVAGTTRNATVRMLTAGVLMRLPKDDFGALIRDPLLSLLSLGEARDRVARGAVWLDARFPDEHRQGAFEGAVNIPLNALRLRYGQLSRTTCYIACCDTGSRSAVAAFLLAARGFDVHCLAGGTHRHGLFRTAVTRPGGELPAPGADPARDRFDGDFEQRLHEREADRPLPSHAESLAGQRAHREGLRRRADAAREAARAHDRALLDELAARLRDGD